MVCPRVLRPFRNLFTLANPNNPPSVNYAQDSKHLVFISGFKLPTGKKVKSNYSIQHFLPIYKECFRCIR